jgi:hypothetical protein
MVRISGKTLGLLAFTALLTGCAAAPPADEAGLDPAKDGAIASRPSRPCFYANAIERYTPIDDNHLEIKDYSGRTYEVGLSGACFSLESTLQIGFRTRGGQRVCGAHDAEIVYNDQTSGRLRTCQIVSVTEISPPIDDKDKPPVRSGTH